MPNFKYFSKTTVLALCSVMVICADGAIASPLTFRGQNAALFPDANPNDTAALMNSVRKPVAKAATAPVIDPARLIQQSLQSQISSKIYDDIFNSAALSGTFDLGGGNIIHYDKAGGYITITITDPVNGSTVLSIPQV